MLESRFGGVRRYRELERLICAALSNQRFAAELVTSPNTALDDHHHRCELSPVERAMVTSIVDAKDIYDFAARLLDQIQHHTSGDKPWQVGGEALAGVSQLEDEADTLVEMYQPTAMHAAVLRPLYRVGGAD